MFEYDPKLKQFIQIIEKLNIFNLATDFRENLEFLRNKFSLQESDILLKVLSSHLSHFLHNLHLSLGSQNQLVESLWHEVQSLSALIPFPDFLEIEKISSAKKELPFIAVALPVLSASDPKNLRKNQRIKSLCNEQKRLDRNIKFKKFLKLISRYAFEQQAISKKVFISYAWPTLLGNRYGEKWTKGFIKRLSAHLCDAGFQVFLDEFHSGGGYSLRKFMNNISNMDHVLIFNTQTMQEKLLLEQSGVKYEAAQIKKALENKKDVPSDFIINILFNGELYSDANFHHYHFLEFIDNQSELEMKYYKILGQLIGQFYNFSEEKLLSFNKVYQEQYQAQKIDADFWHVEHCSPFHLRRTQEMSWLEESKEPIIVLESNSGIGKSELVRKYVWDSYAKYDTVYWFNAKSLDKLKKDFKELRPSLSESEFEIDLFFKWVKEQKNCLIILDHWEIADIRCYEALKDCAPHKIILTTDSNTNLLFPSLKIGPWNEKEARTYIETVLGEQSEDLISRLLKLVGTVPYRLACACGYIQRETKTIQKFISIYQTSIASVFKRPLFPIPRNRLSYNSVAGEESGSSDESTKSYEQNHFLFQAEEHFSERGYRVKQFLIKLEVCVEMQKKQIQKIVSTLLHHFCWLLPPSEKTLSDKNLIENMYFCLSHLDALAKQFPHSPLVEIVDAGKTFLSENPLPSQVFYSPPEPSIEKSDSPPVVQGTQDDLAKERERFEEQKALEGLINIERAAYEHLFKWFLNDIWQYSIKKHCYSKKIYLFYVLSEKIDEREWLKTYIENMHKHLSYVGFLVYFSSIRLSESAKDTLLKELEEMDHVLVISTPYLKEKQDDPNSWEFLVNQKLLALSKKKSERFILPLLTNNINYLLPEWRELAEFSFFKNDYLNEFKNVVKILYGLGQREEFDNYYQQKVFYHGLRSNRWRVPQRASCFIGRESQLDTIIENFGQKNEQVVVITAAGMGGAGKTHLTLQYIHLHGHEYQKIYWIDAASEDTLNLSYAELAEEMRLPLTEEAQKSIHEKVHVVKKALERRTGWLLVYDNADSEEFLKKFIPIQGGKILVTSRNTAWENAIPVEVFTFEETEEYLFKMLGKETLEKESNLQTSLKDIWEITGGLPLALLLICAYIKKQAITLQDYIIFYKNYKQEQDKLLLQNSEDVSISTIWNISLQKIEEESAEASKLLYFCSQFHHENIPEYILNKFFDYERNDEMKASKARRVAEEYSMLKVNEKYTYFSLHILVQKAIKIQLQKDKKLTEYLRKSIIVLLMSYSQDDTHEAIQIKRDLLSHFQEALKNWDIYFQQSDTVSLGLLELILHFLGDAYIILGDVKRSKEFFERALTIQEKYYGNDHCKVAGNLVNLSQAYGDLGDMKRRKELLERALTIQEKHYGNDHYMVGTILMNLGTAYGALGDTKRRKEFLERALIIRAKYYGNDHYMVANVLLNLGNAYIALGDAQKGKELFEHTLPIQEKYYGKEHYKVANILVNLSNAYGDLGDTKLRKELLERALPIQEKHYSKDHYKVAITLGNLGSAYIVLGDVQKGIDLLERALTIQEKHYGNDHYMFAKILRNLGSAYGDLGDTKRSKDLVERALTIQEKHYGNEHYEIANTLETLSNVYGALGDTKGSKELLERALPILETHYGNNHYKVASTLMNLGNAYSALGDMKRSKELLERALPILEKHYSNDHYNVAQTLVNLGTAYIALGYVQKGKELLERALSILEKNYGNDHHMISKTLMNLGTAYGALGDMKRSKELLERALPIHEKYYGNDDYMVANILVNLSNTYITLGDSKRRKELLERALPILEKYYGNDHYMVGITLVHLGNAYGDLVDTKRSKDLLKRALPILEKHFGNDPYRVAHTLIYLGKTYVELKNFKKARLFFQRALDIYHRFNHPAKEYLKLNLRILDIRQGNNFLLQSAIDVENAKLRYRNSGFSLDPEKIETHKYFSSYFYELNQLPACIEHYKIILNLDSKNSSALHNLACMLHIKAQYERIKKNEGAYLDFLKEAKIYFETSIALNPHTVVYTEYANFLLQNSPFYAIEEIISILHKAIQLKQVNNDLSYGIMEKITVDDNLKNLIDEHEEIRINAYFFSHYLLVQAYLKDNKIEDAKKVYTNFNLKVKEVINKIEDEKKYLLFVQRQQPETADQTFKALERQKLRKIFIEALFKFSKEMIQITKNKLEQPIDFSEEYESEQEELQRTLKMSLEQTPTVKELEEYSDEELKAAIELSLQKDEALEESNLEKDKKAKLSISSLYAVHGMLGKNINKEKMSFTEKERLNEMLTKLIFKNVEKSNVEKIEIALSDENGLTIQFKVNIDDEEALTSIVKFFTQFNYESCQFDYPFFHIKAHKEIEDFVNIYLKGDTKLFYQDENLDFAKLTKNEENYFIM